MPRVSASFRDDPVLSLEGPSAPRSEGDRERVFALRGSPPAVFTAFPSSWQDEGRS